MTLQAAAPAKLDTVSTVVYTHGVDDEHVHTITTASIEGGSDVALIQLTPPTETLRERLQAPSRAGTKKITDAAVLDRMMTTFDLRTPYRPDDLTIDNANVTADDVARTIGGHVGLSPA